MPLLTWQPGCRMNRHFVLMALMHIAIVTHAAAQGDATEPSAAVQIALPKDPGVACSTTEQRKATKCPASYDVFVHLDHFSDEEQQECCRLLSSYFGPNATAGDGANCFCHPAVWNETLAREERNYLSYAAIFDSCTGLGHPIYYYQDGAGPCNPSVAAEAPSPAALAPVATPHIRSFSEWMRSLPSNNPVLIAAIAVTIPSVIGFAVVIVWPVLFFSALEVGKAWQFTRFKISQQAGRT